MRSSDDEWEQYLADRKAKHFTLIQVAPAPHWAGETDRQGEKPFYDKACLQLNPAFWQAFERKIQRANEAGFVVLLVGLMEPVERYPEPVAACLFARNIVARLFGNFVIFSPSFDSKFMPLADEVGLATRQATAVHLITQHPGTPSRESTPLWTMQYYDRPYLDIAGVQTGHNGGNRQRCAQQTLDKLALPKIGSDGRLLEWCSAYEEADPGHRHLSHLYGMHPGSRITMDATPTLAAAVRKSLEYRLERGAAKGSGAGQIVWSRAWVLNFWARLLDGEKAHAELRSFMQRTLEPNLCKKWGTRPYCLDANPGVTAGIAEMLIQSHAGEVHLLPALPKAWPKGSFKGLRARGSFTFDVSWDDGKLQRARIVSEKGGPLRVRYGPEVWNFETRPGQEFSLPVAAR